MPRSKSGAGDRGRFDRGVVLTTMLHNGASITARTIMDRFGVSHASACRDLVDLERLLPVVVIEEHREPWPHPRKILKTQAAHG